ncbi:hotdog fold thioesterase [Arthrobacter sp. 35W]|uniref:hotdog fold thioesterase n=1 Tax=Arthrobacter sp. 35W TaxID=1132441 RepID=UPI00042312CD|nr:hotdog fold thioesterase [Arthrobacter sp. 35W]
MALSGADTSHPLLANDRASAWLGISVLSLGDGAATIAMTLRPEMTNGFGIAHGGMLFAFADSAFALACNPAGADAGTVTVASGVDVNFLAPVRAGQQLTAVATRRSQNGRSGLYDVQIFADDGPAPEAGRTVVAEFRGRSRTVPMATADSALSSQSVPSTPAAG